MSLWPDLSRFGWQLGVLVRETEGKRAACGLFLEFTPQATGMTPWPATVDALKASGFSQVIAVGTNHFRMESSQTKFSLAQLGTWFPGFDAVADMRERYPVVSPEPPQAVSTDWHYDQDWPRKVDLEAVDSAFGLHGWEFPADAFARVAEERMLRLDAAGQVLDAEVATERMLDILSRSGQQQDRRPLLAQRMLGRIATAAHESLKSANVVAVERIGPAVLMPPLRIFREGEAITSAFADHQRMVMTAMTDYPVPDEAMANYRPKSGITPEQYAQIMANPEQQLEWQDVLDDLFGKRLIDIRNALRARGWEGEQYGPLYREGVEARFSMVRVGAGYNVVGLTVNGLKDDLTLTPAAMADHLLNAPEPRTREAALAYLASYPEDDNVGMLLEAKNRENSFARALFEAVDPFEVPVYAAMTVGKFVAHVRQNWARETQDRLDAEKDNLQAIADVSQKLGLKIDASALASDALRESGQLDLVVEPTIAALQAELHAAEPFTAASMALNDTLQQRVLAEVQTLVQQGEMPVFRVSDSVAVSLSPSSKQDGYYQATRFSDRGIISDSQYGTLEEAIRSEGLWFVPRLEAEVAVARVAESVKAELAYQERQAGETDAPAETAKKGEFTPIPDAVEVVAPTKTRRSRKPATEDRIDDVGEKIGGARKDFYRQALCLADLEAMNDHERDEFVKKANIWPWSPKEALEKGAEPCVVQWIKTLRRTIREFGDRSGEGAQAAERYIEAVSELRDAVGTPLNKAELIENLKAFRLRLYEEEKWLPFAHPVTLEPIGREQRYLGDYRSVVSAVGWKAFNMAELDGYRPRVPGGFGPPVFTVNQWQASNAERYERNPEYGRSKLLPNRRSVKTDTDEKAMPERPHLANLVHSGFPDVRQGRDIEAEELLTRFGFRGIEFGNWVPQDERQMVINLAYDAMHALCDILGVEPRMASLYGRLALAFGARGRGGKGAFVAHYEPMRTVINLTRIRGAGSLAHEWRHAWDHLLGELLTKKIGLFLSDAANLAGLAQQRSLEELAEQGMSEHVLAQRRQDGAWPTRAWSETAKAMLALKEVMTTTDKPDALAIQELEGKAETHRGWASSWFRNDIYRYFHDSGSDTSRVGEMARAILDKAIAGRLLFEPVGGGWSAFREDVVAADILQELKIDYKIKLPKKSREQVELNLRTVSMVEGALRLARMTPEEKVALRQRYPNLSDHYFEFKGGTMPSEFMRNAQSLDTKRSSPYWATTLELFARAGEQADFYAMHDQGCQSDYLVHGVEESRFAGDGVVGNPYPAGKEREAIAVAMKKVMDSGCQVIREHALALEKKTKPAADVGMAA